ncbi:sensor domain-containing diguanylate cyclase [Desulfoluna sp.]|uniref:sensor domain-containing diguanylate cyclase n=1 Tax=Desulfoluna sp. TaxID=2045199 RepID=UPI002626902B|nr:sensor domain-containing diguanylate cyclase [Desulfoluna sp.]
MFKRLKLFIGGLIFLILGCQCLQLYSPDDSGIALLSLTTIGLTFLLTGLLYLYFNHDKLESRKPGNANRDTLKEASDLWPVFKKVVENMPVMFDAVDENGVVLFWNKECERITGYTSAEIVGNPNALELFYPDPVQRAKNIKEFLEFNGSYRDWEVDLLCKNGDIRTLSWSNTSVKAPIPGWYTWGIGIDVTQRKKAEQQLTEIATRDELTGLINRRKILEILTSEMDRAARYNNPFTLCIVDIDHFKKVNDTHGHNAGDIVLKRLADTIRKKVRRTDSVGRYGGEEFCIILPNTTISQAQCILEHIRQAISSMTFLIDGDTEIRLSISLGQVQYHPGIKEIHELIHLADNALYRAKQSGRNRLCTSAPPREGVAS